MSSCIKSSPLRNAAIFIRSLDADLAAQLLARLSPSEARTLREALRDLGPVDDDELESVAVAMQNPLPKRSAQNANESAVELELNHGHKELERYEATNSRIPARRMNSQLADLEKLTTSGAKPSSPFNSIVETDIETLADFLECEHPQTIAVVFSYLPPNKAAQALAALPEARQAEVICRLSELRDADPTTLEVVERSLEVWLTEQRREQQRRLDRMALVRSILNASQDSTRQSIFMRLRQRDGRLADQLESQLESNSSKDSPRRDDFESPWIESQNANPDGKVTCRDRRSKSESDSGSLTSFQSAVPIHGESPRQLDIEDLNQLSDTQLEAIINYVDPNVLYFALTAVSDSLLYRIRKSLPRKQWNNLQRGVRSLGPISLRDVEAARRIVLECAGRIGVADASERHTQAA